MLQRFKTNLSFNNVKCICLLIVILIAIFVCFQSSLLNSGDDFKGVNFSEKVKNLIIPKKVLNKIETLKVYDNVIKIHIDNNTIVHTHVKQCDPQASSNRKPSVVFLHGASFSSETWHELKSLQLAAAMGHTAIAFDLPGWDKSALIMSDVSTRGKLKRTFLKAFFEEMDISQPIIISPSMSGQFAINYFMEPDSHSCLERMSGFMALAPVNTEVYTFSQYHQCEAPTLIMFGRKDKHLGLVSTNYLRNMPRSEILVVEEAGHAWYVEKPEDWSKALFYFLNIFV